MTIDWMKIVYDGRMIVDQNMVIIIIICLRMTSEYANHELIILIHDVS